MSLSSSYLRTDDYDQFDDYDKHITLRISVISVFQYQEEVEILNTEAKQRPHLQLITGIQRENRHLREIQAENKELRSALEDHQNALELIMSKYRQQTASLLRLSKTDFSSLHNTKYANVST